MNIGIDKIGFYSPNLIIDMRSLAQSRGIDPDKFTYGLGQDFMAVPPLSQDTVTLAANAALTILDDADKSAIDLIILATESGIDASKAGATTIQRLLGINPFSRAIEMKQACYSATAGIQLAKGHIALNPDAKVLVIASDISRYGLATPGEPTQGAGSVAMLIAKDPKIMVLEDKPAYFTDDIHDFYRPNYSDTAVVDGKYSNEQYQRFFETTYERYLATHEFSIKDFNAFCFHIPYTKIGQKALQSITEDTHLLDQYKLSTFYNRKVGNIYTGSLYLNLLSLLHKGTLEPGERIGLYSYGSGAVAEFFSGVLVEGYRDALDKTLDATLDQRRLISIPEYERIYTQRLVSDGSHQILNSSEDTGNFKLTEIKGHQRYYNY